MDASQKGKAVVDAASLRDQRKLQALETAAERKKEVEAALSRSKGIVIKAPEPRRPAVAPKSSSVPPPAPSSKSVEVSVVPSVCPVTEKATLVVDEEDSILQVIWRLGRDLPPRFSSSTPGKRGEKETKG